MVQPVTGESLQIIRHCEAFARRFLNMPEDLQYWFDDCPSERFPSIQNCAEADEQNVYFNLPWFEKQLPDYQKNLELFIFHELRHVHQKAAIESARHNEPCRESEDVIRQWAYDFDHYVRNVDAKSQEQNLIQEVELDANGYALSLLNLYYISQGETNMRLQHSIPSEIYPQIDSRSRVYYKTMPELRQFVNEYVRSLQQRQATSTNSKDQRATPHRNSFCPCGSGKKFKKCCIGKGIYD